MTTSYFVSPRHRVRQLKDKARYDRETVGGIPEAGLVAHVGFVPDGRPRLLERREDDDPEDYEIPVWALILPLASTFGTLQDDGRLHEGVEPSEAVLALQQRRL